MRKAAAVLVFLLGFIGTSLAQVSYVTVSGTVTDPNSNPYANAALTVSLVDPLGNRMNGAATPNGQAFNGKSVQATLDATGHFSVQLVPTNILNGGGSCRGLACAQWLISITPPNDSAILTYQPPWVINYQTPITGSVDLSSQLSALAQPIAFLNLKTSQSTIAVSGGLAPGCSSTSPGNVNCSGTGSFANIAVGGTPTGHKFTINALSIIPADWTLDATTALTALQSVFAGAGITADASGNLSTPGSVVAGQAFAQNMNGDYSVAGAPASCTYSGTTYSTQLDCLIEYLFSIKSTLTSNPTVIIPAGVWTTTVGFQFDGSLNGAGAYFAINIRGRNKYTSVIKYTGPASTTNAVYFFPSVLGAFGTGAQLSISDVTLNGGNLAGSCVQVYAVKVSSFSHIICGSFNPASTMSMWADNDPAQPVGYAWGGFQNTVDDLFISGNGKIGTANVATVTATVSGGGIANNGYAVTSGGAYNFPNPPVYLIWPGGQTCTTPPVGLAATTSGSGTYTVTGVTSTAPASGCPASAPYVLVKDMTQAKYGAYLNAPDSTVKDLVVSQAGTIAGIYAGSPVFIHAHPYNQPVGILLKGANNAEVECDSQDIYCFSINGTGVHLLTVGNFFDDHAYYTNASTGYIADAGFNTYLIGGTCLDLQTAGGYYPLVTTSGGVTFPLTGKNFPSGTVIPWFQSCTTGAPYASYFGATITDMQSLALWNGLSSPVTNPNGGSFQTLNQELFGTTSGSPFMGFLAGAYKNTVTASGSSLIFSGDGAHNAGVIRAVDASGNYFVQPVPSTGGTDQTFPMANIGAAGQPWCKTDTAGAQTCNGGYKTPSGTGTLIPTGATAYLGSATGGPLLATNTLGCTDGYDHLSCAVASVSQTGKTAAIASTTLLTTSSVGLYRVTPYVWAQTTATGSVQACFSWNDGVGAKSKCITALDTSVAGNKGWDSITFYSASGQTIGYSTTYSGTAQYGIAFDVERLQ